MTREMVMLLSKQLSQFWCTYGSVGIDELEYVQMSELNLQKLFTLLFQWYVKNIHIEELL